MGIHLAARRLTPTVAANSASYSGVVVDVPGSEHVYDRLLLADLAQDLCPPSYKIKSGKLLSDDPVETTWMGEEPAMWFLKGECSNGRLLKLGLKLS